MEPSLRWTRAAALYLLTALVFTYPAVRHLGSAAIGVSGDAWYWVWNFDWTFRALFHGAGSALHPLNVFVPGGVDLGAAYDGLLAVAISLPLRAILGSPIATYNAVMLLGYTTSALGMYALARRVTRSEGGGLVAGFVFGFSPMLIARAEGHANLMFAGVLPLTALAALRLLERPNLQRGALAGASVALAVASSFYYGIIAAVAFATILLFHLVARSVRWSPSLLRSLGAALVVGVVLTLIPAAPFLRHFGQGETVSPPTSILVENSADVLGFFTPTDQSNLRRWLASSQPQSSPRVRLLANQTEGANYLGTVALALALLGFARAPSRRDRWLWTTVALVGATFALGPLLTAFGRVLPIPLPYLALQLLPGIGLANAPSRFTMLAHLGVAMLAAFGFTRALPRTTGRRLLVAIPILLLLVLERIGVPFATTRPPFSPTVASELRSAAASGARVAILPAGLSLLSRELTTLSIPALTGAPLTEGFIIHTGRLPELGAQLDQGPLGPFNCYREQTDGAASLPPEPSPTDLLTQLHRSDIRYIGLATPFVRACGESGARTLRATQGWSSVSADDRLTLLRVPDTLPAPLP